MIGYMRSWSAAQELYHTRHGWYADADNQLFDEGLIDGHAPADNHCYSFSMDNPPGAQHLVGKGSGLKKISKSKTDPVYKPLSRGD